MSDIGLSIPHVEETSLKPLGAHRSNSYCMGYVNPERNWEICWAFRQCKDSFKPFCTPINANLQTTHKVDVVSILQVRIVRPRKVAHLDKTLGPDPGCWTENKASANTGQRAHKRRRKQFGFFSLPPDQRATALHWGAVTKSARGNPTGRKQSPIPRGDQCAGFLKATWAWENVSLHRWLGC